MTSWGTRIFFFAVCFLVSGMLFEVAGWAQDARFPDILDSFETLIAVFTAVFAVVTIACGSIVLLAPDKMLGWDDD